MRILGNNFQLINHQKNCQSKKTFENVQLKIWNSLEGLKYLIAFASIDMY